MKNAMFGLSEGDDKNLLCQRRDADREGQTQYDLKFVPAQIEEN